MTERIIPVADLRYLQAVPHIPQPLIPATGLLSDKLGRPLRDLRISVTDRCNFRCVYCMPKEVFDKDYQFLPHGLLLSFEEITRVAKIFIAHGVEKIRLTGGEPLLRKHIEKLIEMLASLTTLSGKPLDLTMTTNGSLLTKKAQSLKDAGLKRVTVSLDSLDDTTFKQMNDVDFPVSDVLEGIEAAHRVGLGPVKVNMVVKVRSSGAPSGVRSLASIATSSCRWRRSSGSPPVSRILRTPWATNSRASRVISSKLNSEDCGRNT